MARARKVHVQQELLNASGTKKARKRRPAARPVGRPRKARAGSPHKKRASFKARSPVHASLRVEKIMGSLRRRCMWHAVRSATFAVASREDFRIVHVSVQRTHVHLLVEADGPAALARGMQAFQISAAKHMNAALKWEVRRRGKVFSDRYHAEIITSRRQARHALAYVLNNWRKHREDGGRSWNVDPFSSGCSFAGWKGLEQQTFMWELPPTYFPAIVWLPRTWLLREGWMMYGRIDFREIPSARTTERAATREPRLRQRAREESKCHRARPLSLTERRHAASRTERLDLVAVRARASACGVDGAWWIRIRKRTEGSIRW